MNLELLKFLGRKVYLMDDENEYTVLGIYWASEHLLLGSELGSFSMHYSVCELVPEEDDEEGWYSA